MQRHATTDASLVRGSWRRYVKASGSSLGYLKSALALETDTQSFALFGCRLVVQGQARSSGAASEYAHLGSASARPRGRPRRRAAVARVIEPCHGCASGRPTNRTLWE